MKRIAKEKFRNKKIVAIAVAVLLTLFAIILIFLPDIFPAPAYEDLYEKEIVVLNFERDYRHRGGYVYRIYTDDDEVYNLIGNFEYENIKSVLVSGVKAKIRWSKNPFIIFPDYAEEVIVNEKVIVSYDSDIDRGSYVFLGIIVFIFAIIYLLIRFWWIKHLQTMQKKRDNRIEKKYGKSE